MTAADHSPEDGAARIRVKAAGSDERVSPSTATHYVSLPDLDFYSGGVLVYPPERVVQVCVVGDVTCLSVCKYDEDGRKQTVEVIEDVTLNTAALLAAIVSQLDPDVGDIAVLLQRHGVKAQLIRDELNAAGGQVRADDSEQPTTPQAGIAAAAADNSGEGA